MKINNYYFFANKKNNHSSVEHSYKSNLLSKHTDGIKTIPAQLCRDSFNRNVSFKSDNIDNTLVDFVKWSNETDFLSKAREIVEKTGEILGSGFEGITYSIPDCDKWIIKEFKRSNLIPSDGNPKGIIPLEDICPALNVGQVIAKVEVPNGEKFVSQYFILKRQSGVSHGISYGDSNNLDEFNIKKHLKSLEILSKFPQESFDKCIQDISYITKQGYQIDCCNPYNFMIDNEKKSINFVDINDRISSGHTQYGNVLYSLLDGEFGILFSSSDLSEEIKETSKKYSDDIALKFFRAMKKTGVKLENSDYFNKLLKSNILNNILNADTEDAKIKRLQKSGLM